MKSITLSADESLIEAACTCARAEQTTLDERLRRWLAACTRTQGRMDCCDAVMRGLRGKLKVGRKISRESI